MGELPCGDTLLAKAYDDTDGEHIADLYSYEAIAELKDTWWIRIEMQDSKLGE